MRATIILAVAASMAVAACDEDNPFQNVPPFVIDGTSQVWELELEGFPSAFNLGTGSRFFVGVDDLGPIDAMWVLAAREDGTLVFRPFSTVVVPAFSLLRVGIQDMGPVSFESVTEAPDSGYSNVSDSTGVPVIEGHVYTFRITQLGTIPTQINFAKLDVIEVGRQFPEDPRSRFIRFRWAFQVQPLNRTLVVEDE